MDSEKLALNINTDRNNYIIEGKDIDRIKVISAMRLSTSCDFNVINNVSQLTICDCICGCCVGSSDDIVSRTSLNPLSNTVRIQVPKDKVVNLEINNERSDIILRDVIFSRVDIRNMAGNVKIKDCHSDDISVYGIATNINLTGLSGEYFDINTFTGNIKLVGEVATKTSLTSGIGNVSVYLMEESIKQTSIDAIVKNLPPIIIEQKYDKQIKVRALHGKFHNNLF